MIQPSKSALLFAATGLGCASAFGLGACGSDSTQSASNGGRADATAGLSGSSAGAAATSAGAFSAGFGASTGASGAASGGSGNTAGSSAAAGGGGMSGSSSAGNGAGGSAAGGSPSAAGSSGAAGSPSSAGGGGFGGTDSAPPGVRVVGRTATASDGTLRFSWSGVNIHARFSGSQVSMDLNDGNNKNRFTIVVDGGTPKTVTSGSGQTSLSLASGLANGTHDALIWKNTEAAFGITQFSGLSKFGPGGALLAPPPAPDRRIEVIGDSLSAGAGVEGTSTSCNPNIDAFTNDYLAYGSVAARSVDADIVTIAWSGIGVYRNYSAGSPTMPQRYDYAIPNDGTAWDFAKYSPHVVVINLGTNDFGAGNPGQPYVDAYVSFVKHVRSKYPSANLLLIDMYGGDRLTALNDVVTASKNGGESRLETLSFSSVPNNNTACNGHPNVTAQKAMGNLLATRLKALMGW